LLIQEIIEEGGIVTLLPRPRRFGKTMNMSMLKYFFEKTVESHIPLFEDKLIWKVPHVREMQGKFPVIFITFKDIQKSKWKTTYNDLIRIIANEYRKHEYLYEGDFLKDTEKAIFKDITSLVASESDYHMSLLYLSDFLERYYEEKVVILIDEYDAPIHAGLMHDYYKDVIEFMQSLLGGAFKDNVSLQWGVVIGILRTAKEGIFSGINNLEVFTVLDAAFADKFGFTDAEVEQLLNDYNLGSIKSDFQSWYNGYLIGNTKIYNPWSSLSCVKRKGELRSYWANTSDNGLISKIIESSGPQIKDACGELVQGNILPKIPISDHMVFPIMATDPNAIWSLLLFSGYLTAASHYIYRGVYHADLMLPNQEISSLFQDLISQLFNKRLDDSDILFLKKALQNADGQLFSLLLSKFMVQSMSWHDISGNEPEKSYHLFVLGLLVIFSGSYAIRSNRESGYGRYDILMSPHNQNFPGLIIEFKKKESNETMEECANRGLEQIINKKYGAELEGCAVQRIVFFAVAFHGKDVLLKQTSLNYKAITQTFEKDN